MNLATTSGEGSDRADLSLPSWQDALVPALVAANKNTVVVVRCPGACLMPWVDVAPAIVFSLMPGQVCVQQLSVVVCDALVVGGGGSDFVCLCVRVEEIQSRAGVWWVISRGRRHLVFLPAYRPPGVCV